MALLPHRPPFRFVDRVDELVPGERIVARYRVTGDEAFLAGHFPGNPIFPGVIQLEALAQAGAIALLASERYAGSLPLFGGVEEVRWRRMVRPGDELTLDRRDGAADVPRRLGHARPPRSRASRRCQGRLFFVIAPAPDRRCPGIRRLCDDEPVSSPTDADATAPPVDRDLLDFAVDVAREAGESTLRWFQTSDLTVDSKADGTPVTAADRARRAPRPRADRRPLPRRRRAR